MKTLLIVSEESILTGNIKCGMAELVSSLATALTSDYKVLVLTPDGAGLLPKLLTHMEDHGDYRDGSFLKVHYYLYRTPEAKLNLLNSLEYDIFHNFDEPELITKLARTPEKTIYTFETTQIDHSEYLPLYTNVTTISNAHMFTIMRQRSTLAQDLMNSNFSAVATGIASEIFNPASGLLIKEPFSPLAQGGKVINKKFLCETYNIPEDKAIYVMMCRLIPEKGIETIISALPLIKKNNGIVLLVGKGNRNYEETLRQYTRNDGLIWVNTVAKPTHSFSLLAGADFYLSPSLYESCGLMPLNACRYGTIPITTLNGGLGDNLKEENAIIIYDDIEPALEESFALYRDPVALATKRKSCMEYDFSWQTRKKGYIDIYDA